MRLSILGAVELFVLLVSACANASGAAPRPTKPSRYIAREDRGGSVTLVPMLEGGTAGWCLATTVKEAPGVASSGCGEPPTSTGPIFAEACSGNKRSADVGVVAARYVPAVSIEGGRAIPTRPNSSFPDGLRTVVVEIRARSGKPVLRGPRASCPRLTPLSASGSPLRRTGKRGLPLTAYLPGGQGWNAHPGNEICLLKRGEPASACRLPTTPPAGPCDITLARSLDGVAARRGTVLTRIETPKPVFGQALLSCVDVEFEAGGEGHFDAAVLLDASHPGAPPPSLPDTTPLPHHPEVFRSSGWGGALLARGVPGGWLVVEERFGGLELGALKLLEALRATVTLPTHP